MNSFLTVIGMKEVSAIQVLVKLLLAVLCGGILGIDRTKKRRAAGIRTYSMVCLGATLVMTTGISIYEATGLGDPTRLGAQVVSGIGFIGAGTIIVTGYHEVKGLTTAAGIWTAACLGLAIGAGYYLMAIISCVLLYSILRYGASFQDKLVSNIKQLRIYIAFSNNDSIMDFMINAQRQNLIVQDCQYLNNPGIDMAISMILTIKIPDDIENDKALSLLSNCTGVLFTSKIQ